MNLDQYLRALESCPDEFLTEGRDRPLWRATAELGVYDNWPILLNADFEKVLDYLKNSDFTLFERRRKREQTYVGANYNPGTVKLQVWNYVNLKLIDGWTTSERWSQEHRERQMKDFCMGIMLHPYQERQMEGINQIRALAMVIGIIGKYALENKVPLCFPQSIGWNNPDDYSQIVYHP